ncbi:hypothetical protein B0I35DRAFT_434474 [Stachybotrys elegans]|uniref:Uncharacterized protein n=1 Tax=Stachybotrys elegans TaxID=80388 RepID=A0A8K0STV0_9HYPO|nr:hypothetical protein B0I35DRAFT_434474 [Stachybotrys elegans]
MRNISASLANPRSVTYQPLLPLPATHTSTPPSSFWQHPAPPSSHSTCIATVSQSHTRLAAAVHTLRA